MPKRIELRFLLNPVRFEARKDEPDSLGAVICERTRLEGETGEQQARGTGEYETLPAQLALISIGYKSIPLSGIEHWFDDEKDRLRHEHGLVDRRTVDLGGLYTSGWLKRGPSGIIGTNIGDAKDTVTTIITDFEEFVGVPKNSTILAELLERGVQVVDWDGYRRIEEAEKARRRSDKQPREKIVSTEEQLQASLVKL